MEIYNMIFRDEPLHVKVGELYLTVLRRLADLPEAGLGAPRRAARPETEEGGAQSNIYIFSTLWRNGKLNSISILSSLLVAFHFNRRICCCLFYFRINALQLRA